MAGPMVRHGYSDALCGKAVFAMHISARGDYAVRASLGLAAAYPAVAAHRIGLADEQVDAGGLGLRSHEVTPVRVVRDAVGLDHPDRAPVLEDHVVLDLAPAFECLAALFEGDLERVAPPFRDVLCAQPFLDLRQVGFLEGPETDHSWRRRSESSARSSCTPSARQTRP